MPVPSGSWSVPTSSQFPASKIQTRGWILCKLWSQTLPEIQLVFGQHSGDRVLWIFKVSTLHFSERSSQLEICFPEIKICCLRLGALASLAKTHKFFLGILAEECWELKADYMFFLTLHWRGVATWHTLRKASVLSQHHGCRCSWKGCRFQESDTLH